MLKKYSFLWSTTTETKLQKFKEVIIATPVFALLDFIK